VPDDPDIDSFRVRPDSVRSVFNTAASDGELKAWIRVAHRVVEDRLVGEGVPAETLTEIERQLAAHFTTITDPATGDTSFAGTQTEDTTEVGLHLNQSRYGQAAKVLDPTGRLAAAEDGSSTVELKTF
jgi:hypothetical protein